MLTTERNDEIIKKHADGMRVKDIGRMYGLSPYRIYQILHNHHRDDSAIYPQYVLYSDLRKLDLSLITLDSQF